MKVYLSNYRHHWFSPYTMIDKFFFWTEWSKCHRANGLARAMSDDENKSKWVDRPAWVEKWHDRLTPLSEAIQTSLNFIHPKIGGQAFPLGRWSQPHLSVRLRWHACG